MLSYGNQRVNLSCVFPIPGLGKLPYQTDRPFLGVEKAVSDSLRVLSQKKIPGSRLLCKATLRYENKHVKMFGV